MGPGGQGLGIEMDWTEQTWKQPKSPCPAQLGQSGEPDVALGLDPQVQQGFWSAVLVRSTRPGFWATELLGTTLQ